MRMVLAKLVVLKEYLSLRMRGEIKLCIKYLDLSGYLDLPRRTMSTRCCNQQLRFAKDECLDLPDVMYQTRNIELTPQASKYYKQLKTQMLIEAGGEQVTAVNAAAGMNKLLQISGGAVYTDTKETVKFDIKPRLKALLEAIEETSEKVLVFVPYRHTIKLVSEYLVENGITNDLIHGDVSASDRGHIINGFQSSDEPRALVIQPQSASHGVTLTRA